MRRAQLGAAVILAGTIAACTDSAPPAGSVRRESLVAAASPTTPETTTLPEVTTTTELEPVTTTTEATTTTVYDWGPVLCPRLRHPAHHEPCPVTTSPATVAPPVAGTGACGGDLPPCWVMNRESGGDPTVWNRQGSGASGKWQVMPGTWAGYGGYSAAAYAPESVQDEFARRLWAGGAGCAHWSACG